MSDGELPLWLKTDCFNSHHQLFDSVGIRDFSQSEITSRFPLMINQRNCLNNIHLLQPGKTVKIDKIYSRDFRSLRAHLQSKIDNNCPKLAVFQLLLHSQMFNLGYINDR